MGQLLDNLLDNAAKYSPAWHADRDRLVAARRLGSALRSKIGGPASRPADLPHVFEPFYRSAAARREGRAGVGLGLAVAQRIVASLGGTITVESPGRGTRFTVGFPESLPRQGPASAGNASPGLRGITPSSGVSAPDPFTSGDGQHRPAMLRSRLER